MTAKHVSIAAIVLVAVAAVIFLLVSNAAFADLLAGMLVMLTLAGIVLATWPPDVVRHEHHHYLHVEQAPQRRVTVSNPSRLLLEDFATTNNEVKP